MTVTALIAALRARPGMYLGPNEPGARLKRLILEALWALLVDAATVEGTTVYLGTDGDYVLMRHGAHGTPLTSRDMTIEWMDIAMSTIGAHSKASGILPWSKWTGLPLVNAYSADLTVRSTIGSKVIVFRYRDGSRWKVDNVQIDPGGEVGGVELRFRADARFVGSVQRLPDFVDQVLARVSDDDRAKVSRLVE